LAQYTSCTKCNAVMVCKCQSSLGFYDTGQILCKSCAPTSVVYTQHNTFLAPPTQSSSIIPVDAPLPHLASIPSAHPVPQPQGPAIPILDNPGTVYLVPEGGHGKQYDRRLPSDIRVDLALAPQPPTLPLFSAPPSGYEHLEEDSSSQLLCIEPSAPLATPDLEF